MTAGEPATAAAGTNLAADVSSPPTPGAVHGFSRVRDAAPDRLHAAAHSHHPWPDASFRGQQDAWVDAATLLDRKWERVFGDVLPETQTWIARTLELPDPTTIAVAPNTHALLVRLLSCCDPPVRILTTDGEFTSFERQVRRLAEDGLVVVDRVPQQPWDTLSPRLAAAAAAGGHDLVFFSHVLYASGFVVADLPGIVAAVPDDDTFVVVDGYHGFMALPTSLAAIGDRAFYLAGGYKYAMAGEGVCFAHCPPGYGPRPRNTGWFADMASVGTHDRVSYAEDGRRFLGATFDPTGLYRFNAVRRWLWSTGWTVPAIHRHVVGLQQRLLDAMAGRSDLLIDRNRLLAGPTRRTVHGHLLAFAHDDAAGVTAELARRDVVVDHRRGSVRIGLGIYHDADDVDALVDRLRRTTATGRPGTV